jgi:hypothetical protein
MRERFVIYNRLESLLFKAQRPMSGNTPYNVRVNRWLGIRIYLMSRLRAVFDDVDQETDCYTGRVPSKYVKPVRLYIWKPHGTSALQRFKCQARAIHMHYVKKQGYSSA